MTTTLTTEIGLDVRLRNLQDRMTRALNLRRGHSIRIIAKDLPVLSPILEIVFADDKVCVRTAHGFIILPAECRVFATN